MMGGVAFLALWGLFVTIVFASEPINWNNIVFEWVTVTVTGSDCAAPTRSTSSSTAFPTAASFASLSLSSLTEIPTPSAQILVQPIVQDVVTSIPTPEVRTSWASTATYASSSSSAPISTAILRPALVSNIDLADPENLRPKIEHNLYYADDSGAGSSDSTIPIANVKFNFTMDAVNLESSHIQTVTCSADKSGSLTSLMEITFSDKGAYDMAAHSWPRSRDFLLIGYFPGCAGYSQAQRGFSKVHEFFSNDSTMKITAVIEDLPIKEAITEGEIKFGSFGSSYISQTEQSNSSAPYSGVGVPEQCLGSKKNDFDISLDDALGVATDTSTILSRLKIKRDIRRRRNAARFSKFKESDAERLLEKRWSIGGFLSDIGNDIAAAVSSVVDTVKDVAETAWDSISGAMKNIGQAIVAAGKVIIGNEADFDYIDTTAKWNTFLSKDTKYSKSEKIGSPWNTPWGPPGFLLAADTETETRIFCVDCGIKGNIKLNGHLRFSLKDGLKAATFTINGTMHSNVQVGIFAEATWEASSDVLLFDIPLGPIEIPGVFDIGPQIVVNAQTSASITSTGMITAGFSMDWNPYMSLDMLTWESNTKGWEPVLKPMVQVDGEIVASVGVSLPIQIGFGVNLLKGWLLKQVVISEKPGVALSARVAGQALADTKDKSAGFDAGLDRPKDFYCPNSVALFLDFTHSIDLEVLDVFKKNLGKARVPLWQECIGASSSSSSSSSETKSTTNPTSTTSVETTTTSVSITEISVTITGTTSATDSETAQSTTISGTTTTTTYPINPWEITLSDSPTPVVYRRQDTNITTSVSTTDQSTSIITSEGPISAFTTTCLAFSNSSSTLSHTSSSISSFNIATSRSNDNRSVSSSSENIISSQVSTLDTVSSVATSTTINSGISVLNNATIAFSTSIASSEWPTLKTSTFTSSTTSVNYVANSTATRMNPTTSTSSPARPTSSLTLAKVVIKDAADGLFINTNTDGTIYLCNGACGSPAEFYTHSGIVVADTTERVFHGYSSELKAYGVSRFRLHAVYKLPKTAMVVGLYEFQESKVVAVAADKPDEFLLPIACRVEGQATKLFLVREYNAGIATLKELGDRIAGGKVLECSMKNLDLVKV